MVVLALFTLLTALAILAVIWWCVFIYTNKWIATVFVSVIVAIIIMLTVSWANNPTQEEIRKHTYKVLHV